MRFILTALLALYGAEPAATALLHSSLAAAFTSFQHSAAVLAVFGKTELLLQVLFVFGCYEVASLLETWLFSTGPDMVFASSHPRYGSGTSSPKNFELNRGAPAGVKRPE